MKDRKPLNQNNNRTNFNRPKDERPKLFLPMFKCAFMKEQEIFFKKDKRPKSLLN